jgi:hypothetical protein
VALEPLQRQRQVRTPLGRRHRVDLVDDHRLDVGEDVPRLRGQHQVQRLGRGDEDVGRAPQHRLPLALRRVAGAERDAEVGTDPGERRPEVPLDVVGERLQRRDVDEGYPR